MLLTWMKTLAVALPMVLAASSLHAEIADQGKTDQVVVVRLFTDRDAEAAKTLVVFGSPGGGPCCMKGHNASGCKMFALPAGQGSLAVLSLDDAAAPRAMLVAALGNPFGQLAPWVIGLGADDGAGWLGVHLTAVPAPLAAQLDLEGTGVMVGNVVEDSPAQEAGLRRWDVIVALDSERVSDDLGQLVRRIGDMGEGTDIKLTVVRNGAEEDLTVTLGARPESAKTRWTHRFAPGAAIQERIRERAHVLKLGEDGEFKFMDMGALPGKLRGAFPFRHGMTTRIMIDDDQKSFNVVISNGDGTLEIQQDGDGEITVRRTDEDGHVTENVYDSADDLAADDEEAFDIYDSMGQGRHIFIGEDGESGLNFGFDFNIDLEGFDGFKGMMLNLKDLENIHELDEGALEEAMQGLEEALKHLPPMHGEFSGGGPGHGFGGHWMQRRGAEEGDEGGGPGHGFRGGWFGAHGGPAEHSFRVAPDGSIELHIRRGDTEVIQEFQDEDDLADRSPELFEKYDRTRKAMR